MKRLVWIGSSLEDLRKFPEEVKDGMGYGLYLAQIGERYARARTLSGLGSAKIVGLREIDKSGTYRVVYTVEMVDYIFVLHSFQKKSKKGLSTPKQELDLIKSCLKDAKSLFRKLKEGGKL